MKTAAAAIATLCLASFIGLTSQEKAAEQPQAQPNGPYTFSVGSNMVLVPVVVSDKHGQHVTGLTANDFDVREDGKEQAIAGFEEVSAENTVVQRVVVAPNSFTNQVAAAHPKKLEIILLDLLNTPASGRFEARRGLVQFLSKSTEPDTLLALLVLRADGVQIIHNFTSDPAILMAAIKKVQAPVAALDTPVLNTNGGDADAEARQIHAIITGQKAAANGGVATLAKLKALEHGMEALTDKSKEDADGLLTLLALQQIARYFGAVPGRKSLIWASTGFRFSNGSMGGEATRGTTLDDWQRATRLLQDANIAVYPVDVGGLPPPSIDAMAHGDIPVAGDVIASGVTSDPGTGKHQTMDQLASMTGGQAFYNLNDSDEFFRRASRDSGQYYVLAYYTKNTVTPGWRKLSVRVHRDGLHLRTRSGFFFNNAARDPESTRQSEEFNALTSALEATSLPINGVWKQTEVAGDQRKVPFTLMLPPGAILVDREHQNRISIDFLIFVWNADGKESGKVGQRLERPLSPEEVNQIQTRGLSYDNAFTLPPGKYDVHFVVRDNLKGNLGSVVTQVTVE
jgi:VWFA-related protein